jgi:secreted trypsin-like serine protease
MHEQIIIHGKMWCQVFSFTGIVSYGFGCGKIGYPGIYTNVYYFLDWIKDNMWCENQNGLDPKSINNISKKHDYLISIS